MRRYYETPNGSVDGEWLGSGGVRLFTNAGLRPGPYVSDDIIVRLGKAIVAGRPICKTATELGISRRTVQRWAKRLRLGVYAQQRDSYRGMRVS